MLLTKQSQYECITLWFNDIKLLVDFTTNESWRSSIEETDSCEEGGRIIYNKQRVFELDTCYIETLNVIDVAPQLQNLTITDVMQKCSAWVHQNEEANAEDFNECED